MNHSEAVEQMATERYLLDELEPELREEFEEHLFDCPECTLDLRATVAFVEEAKAILPEVTLEAAAPAKSKPKPHSENPIAGKRDRFAWLRPLFANPFVAGPVFAALLIVVGYQNLVVYPALRLEVSEPRAVQLVALHSETRSGEPKAIEVSRKGDLALVIDLPQDAAYPSYALELYDAQGRAAWSKAVSESATGQMGNGSLSLAIPALGLQQGAYALALYGVAANGDRAPLSRYSLQVHFLD